jgi:protein-tyrosine phosphatase
MLLDPRDEAANAIFDFIEEAIENTESVLVHSVRG